MGSQRPQQTTVKQATLNPAWHERFWFSAASMDEGVKLELWDKDVLVADDFMGEVPDMGG